jgi:hypothetical protein
MTSVENFESAFFCLAFSGLASVVTACFFGACFFRACCFFGACFLPDLDAGAFPKAIARAREII